MINQGLGCYINNPGAYVLFQPFLSFLSHEESCCLEECVSWFGEEVSDGLWFTNYILGFIK